MSFFVIMSAPDVRSLCTHTQLTDGLATILEKRPTRAEPRWERRPAAAAAAAAAATTWWWVQQV